MVKLKSIPNQGTRTIHLPVIGDVKFVDGFVEVDESKVNELTSQSFGFKLINPEAGSTVTFNDNEDDDAGNQGNGLPTLEELSALRVKDLQEFFDSLKERGIATAKEEEAYNKMKKPERAEFIFQALQRPAPEDEEEIEEEVDSEEETEE